jgi:hypothetical protein
MKTMKKYKLNISKEPHCCELESLGSIFIPLVKSALSAEDLVGVDILLNWRDIVGNEIFSYCQPIKTKFNPKDNNRTLYLEVPSGGFALEIQHKEKYIIDKINSYFGYNTIHKINITQNINMQIKQNNEEKYVAKDKKISEEDEKYLLSLITEIKDDKLRENLVKIGKNVILSEKGDNK